VKYQVSVCVRKSREVARSLQLVSRGQHQYVPREKTAEGFGCCKVTAEKQFAWKKPRKKASAFAGISERL
jgi:hypothetical protein